jgi:hypothetical protein
MLVRAMIGGVAMLLVAPAALAASRSTGSRLYDGVEVVPSCSSSPGGSAAFQFLVLNRRTTSVGSVRLDVYFRDGTRLMSAPGYHDLRTTFHIAGRHAWRAVQALDVYSGFALQPIVHGARSGTSQRVVFALTVHGARHRFPAWVCTQG